MAALQGVDPVSSVIASLYDASLDLSGESWTTALTNLSLATGASGVAMLAAQRDRSNFSQAVMIRADLRDVGLYQSHYAQIDPCLEPCMASSPAGKVHVTDDLIGDSDLSRTEFYTDWLAPRGWHSGIGSILLNEGSTRAVLFLSRERRAGHFPVECVRRVRDIVPHLQHAVRVASRMAALSMRTTIPSLTLRHLTDAVLVTDARAQIVYSNDSADRVLAKSDAVLTHRPRGSTRAVLSASTSATTAALHALIAAVCAQVRAHHRATPTSPERAAQSGGAIVLQRRAGNRPLMALVSPLRMEMSTTHVMFEALSSTYPEPRAMIILVDPELAHSLTSAQTMMRSYLRAAFAMTDAETAVAAALAEGIGLPAVAADRGVTLATVRSQAANIYRKANVRGQVELASLVARLTIQASRIG